MFNLFKFNYKQFVSYCCLPIIISSSLMLSGCLDDKITVLNLRSYHKSIPGINDTSKYVYIKVKVLDGYIGNAIVCADFDYDFHCDDNIEQQVTDNNGNAILKVKEFIYNSFITHHIIVTVKKDASINNLNGQLSHMQHDMFMMSDTVAGQTNYITPYSTFAQAFVENGSCITKQEAMRFFAKALNVPVQELYEDYNKVQGIPLIAAELLVKIGKIPSNYESIQDTTYNLQDILRTLELIRFHGQRYLDEGYTVSEIIDELYFHHFHKTTKLNHKPVANFKTEINYLNVKLINESTDIDDDPLDYKWELSDGRVFFDHHLDVSFEKPGNYTVSLTVSDQQYDVTTIKEVKVSNHKSCIKQPLRAICKQMRNQITCSANEVVINNCSIFKNAKPENIRYIWTVEDNITYNGQEFVHNIVDSNKNVIKLLVTDGIETDSKTIELYSTVIENGENQKAK